MARCDQGYLCVVCGEEVEALIDSDLYLRYTLGEVDPELLHKLPERHIRCNPALAQFIVTDGFPTVEIDGMFSKSTLDAEFVAAEQARVTSAYLRLHELTARSTPIHEYPMTTDDRAGFGSERGADS